MLSPHPFHASLRRWLCGLYRHSLSEGDLPLEAYVGLLLWECPVPPPGHLTVRLSLAADVIPFALPAPSQQLPLCQVDLGSLLDAFSPADVVRIFAAACREHKIIVVGDSVARIGAAAMAIAALLWPMVWQGVFVPLLPDHMCEFLQSPVPFILGVRAEAYEAAEAMEPYP